MIIKRQLAFRADFGGVVLRRAASLQLRAKYLDVESIQIAKTLPGLLHFFGKSRRDQ